MNQKHIYIDESGTLTNNNIFIICFVIFKNEESLHELSSFHKKFIYKKFKNEEYELHFNKESFATKKSFLKILSKQDLSIRYYQSVDLAKVLTYREHILNSILECIHIFKNSKIYIDSHTKEHDKILYHEIYKLFKEHEIKVKLIKFVNSKSNIFIQVADMCAGCIRRNFEKGSKEDKILFSLLKNKISIKS